MADIEIERINGVLQILINRPAKRNALTAEMYLAIADAMAEAASDHQVGCILIASVGEVFTAGNDIADFLDRPPGAEEGGVIRFLQELATQPKPLVAAVQGPAVGVGTTMLLHCDLVVAADSAVFSTPFTDLGLVPEAGSTYLLPLMAGYRRAAGLLMEGASWSAAEALAAGLISHVRPQGEVTGAAAALAQKLAAKPRAAMTATKALLRSGFREATLQQMEREAEAFATAVRSEEAKAVFARFLKR